MPGRLAPSDAIHADFAGRHVSDGAPTAMADRIRYVIGVDGGGTGSRARVQTLDGRPVGYGRAGPSGLSQGVGQAWRHVEAAIAAAFAASGLPAAPRTSCALGVGLAGAGQPELAAAFLQSDPGYGLCELASDAWTLLLGAHGGRPGIVVASGTGSVGAALHADGSMHLVGGRGFPDGDEGSGAWLGLRAVDVARRAVGEHGAPGTLAGKVWAATGADGVALQTWSASAGQAQYARLAPLVFEAADLGDATAERLLQSAADELALLAHALQPRGAPLPIALCGSVGARLHSRWPVGLRGSCVPPAGDGADGALQLVRAVLAGQPSPARRPYKRL